jgi:hypothetical protein
MVAPTTLACSMHRDACLATGSSRLTMAATGSALSWLGHHGQVGAVGVEGTGSYGAGLAGYLGDQQVKVVEVDRPGRRTRRQRGRSDPIDAKGRRPRGPGWGRDRGAQAA